MTDQNEEQVERTEEQLEQERVAELENRARSSTPEQILGTDKEYLIESLSEMFTKITGLSMPDHQVILSMDHGRKELLFTFQGTVKPVSQFQPSLAVFNSNYGWKHLMEAPCAWAIVFDKVEAQVREFQKEHNTVEPSA